MYCDIFYPLGSVLHWRLGMGVLADFRGMGIGSELVEKTIAHAWSKKFTCLFNQKYQDITIMAQCST